MSKTIILYFSATGTTKKRAQKLAKIIGATLYEIRPKVPYTNADLNWNDPTSRTTIEQHQHNGRVEIVDDLPDISNYDTVIIGHPIWWEITPRLISTVIDKLDLNGKTVTSFGTCGTSTYSRSQSKFDRDLKQNGYHVHLLPGAVLNTDQQMNHWISQLSLA